MQERVERGWRGAATSTTRSPRTREPGRTCAHNLNYWRFGDYLGIGAGAHAKLSFADRVVREVRWKQPQHYLERVAAGDPVMERREVARDEMGFEFMLNALRLTEGVPERRCSPSAPGFRSPSSHARSRRACARGLLDPRPVAHRGRRRSAGAS